MVSEESMDKIFRKLPIRALATFDDGYDTVYNYLVKLPYTLRQCMLFIVAGKVGGKNDWDAEGELAGKRLMDWAQIAELKNIGAVIGSHGLNHLDLRKLDDRELERELKESKRIIEERINSQVNTLAYPFGYYDQRVIAAAKAAGYQEAYTACDSILQGRGNPFSKRRIEIRGTDPPWLVKMKISGLYDLKAVGELPKLLYQKVRCLKFGR